ncbi:hypothetical protein PY310_20520 [Pseudarthrobacter sp. H3Y2-7]|uniref:hypothetical protein n=1 Tax=Pseudarthrobacter naphthalenicus TaxID=3031328 RepID=UPI0023AF1426|nr:hypothetical protein [Pseudarthrobacter sp. H3Y2-7]MDE8670956.1 hypothetical protein [Pseudarthrobacter sp. H3Y2-7]
MAAVENLGAGLEGPSGFERTRIHRIIAEAVDEIGHDGLRLDAGAGQGQGAPAFGARFSAVFFEVVVADVV